ncbi:MAG TPA: hypothetical protein VFG33_09590, partial [Kribbella sp.]|nr:hypothetical protein [Kribbella sp.]
MPVDDGVPGHGRIGVPVVVLDPAQQGRVGQQPDGCGSHRPIGVHQEALDARKFTQWQVIGGVIWTVGLVLAGHLL